MADARALFQKHIKEFMKMAGGSPEQILSCATLYGACIIAEAIRNEQESVDFRVIEPVKKEDVHVEI